MPWAVAAVPENACDLGLMHRVDEAGRRARASEHVADVNHGTDIRAITAEVGGKQYAQKALQTDRSEGFGGKPRGTIDIIGGFGRHGRGRLSARDEVCSRCRGSNRRPFTVFGSANTLKAHGLELTRRNRGHQPTKR